MTLIQAVFDVEQKLIAIAAKEGRMPRVVDVHSMAPIGDGLVSVYLDLDDPMANDGSGVVITHVNEKAVLGLDVDAVMSLLMVSEGTRH